jgi:hypothetical protein
VVPCVGQQAFNSSCLSHICARRAVAYAMAGGGPTHTSAAPSCQGPRPAILHSRSSIFNPCTRRSTLRARGLNFPLARVIAQPNLSRRGSSSLRWRASGTRNGSPPAPWQNLVSGTTDRCGGTSWRVVVGHLVGPTHPAPSPNSRHKLGGPSRLRRSRSDLGIGMGTRRRVRRVPRGIS